MTVNASAKSSPSIRDVAKLARVSHQTVSRVLNDHPYIRPATRERVLAAMAELNYRPNRAARTLATSRSHTIGVLLTASASHYGPASTIAAVEEAARDRGYSVVLASPGRVEVAEFSDALDHLIREGVDGIIAVAPQIRAAAAVAKLHNPVPVVMIQCDSGDPRLSVDNRVGGKLAAEHLWRLGHRRLAHVSGPGDWSEATARRHGFEEALADVGSGPVAIAEGDWSAESGYRAFEHLRDSGCTAVFCANDQMALGLIHAAHDDGRRVPRDLSIIGFDDTPEAAHYLPPLTTIRQDFHMVGRRAVDSLLSALDGTPKHGRSIHPKLVVRDSTSAPA
ncbi:LacI family transcriptional regulator [Flexivirga endophytica]|uniref:LacI family transcriptional regulator n=1 Tax=Flexivirga endophytica TaxID=1849103 RepID=A0A916SYT7_9MICO|nr:LacI family DNA-binding transcriptional regulator [Flexivirga endophytica]GGB22579.1 LacI family transcriptional regulator [Flexivirga endophytica]GHB56514.1 LacI family transcriptional regulator [Flexivirga endophytica]